MMKSERAVLKFWVPLSGTWLMMAAEGPILAAVVAHLPKDIVNLAAYGLAAAVAMLIESPVIGLLSAVITLARDKQSVDRLYRFMRRINTLVSVVMVLACLPWVFYPIATNIIGLEHEVAWRMHVGLLCMIPWPAAIGIRRFYQGLLIRKGRTRSVAQGTAVRITTMISTAMLLSSFDLEGVIVGCCGLTAGVVFEAIATWIIARKSGCEVDVPGEHPPLSNSTIYRFYAPLALTSIVSFLGAPVISTFVSRLPMSIESLAVLPVVNALLFVFRSFGFSYQEVGIAFLGQDKGHYKAVYRVGRWIAIATTSAMVLVAFTPALGYLYTHVFALKPALVQLAILPTQLLVVVPITASMYSLQRAVMITAHRTVHVSISMIIEVGSAVVLMLMFIGWQTVTGALAAGIAIASGIVLSNCYAWIVSRRILREWVAP